MKTMRVVVGMGLVGVMLTGVVFAGCAPKRQQYGPTVEANPAWRASIDGLLDGWHLAASRGDFDGYFGRMTPGAVFLGTDASERWTKPEFEAFAAPHFADGDGWTYRSIDRHVEFGAGWRTAWVDEVLEHDRYGVLRGTAVIVRGNDQRWRIAHYSLTFLVPNEKAGGVVELIRGD